MLGYAIGHLLYDTVGLWLIELYRYGEKVEAMRDFYAQWGWAFILVKGVSPIPFKLITIVSGVRGRRLGIARIGRHTAALRLVCAAVRMRGGERPLRMREWRLLQRRRRRRLLVELQLMVVPLRGHTRETGARQACGARAVRPTRARPL